MNPSTGAPLWTQADFDDSGWETTDLTPRPGLSDPFNGDPRYVRGWTALGHPGYTGYAWYRLQIRTDEARGEQLALAGPYLSDDGFQVYVDGVLLGGIGDFYGGGKSPTVYQPRPTMFLLPASAPEAGQSLGSTVHTVAFRLWMGPLGLLHMPDAGGLHYAPSIGSRSAISEQYRLEWYENLVENSLPPLEGGIFLLLAIVAASLILFDRSDTVYLWVSGLLLLTALLDALVVIETVTVWISNRSLFVFVQCVYFPIQLGGWTMIWWVWFRLRQPRWVPWAIALLTLAYVVAAAMAEDLFVSVLPQSPAANHLASIIVRGLLLALLVLVIAKGIRKDGLAGWMALPAVVPLAVMQFFTELSLLHAPVLWQLFGIQVFVGTVANCLFAAIMALLLLRRLYFSVIRQRQLALDVKQAQEVQQVLIPTAIPEVPGFSIQAVYKPAGEVGGDFFQILPTRDGGVLVAVGDVSGKGLPAAMAVSLLVGTLRTLAHYTQSPGEILSATNIRMLARSAGGFTTCLVLRVDADGTLTVANAGHLAPYLNGSELQLQNGLPLGIAADSLYEESVFHLTTAERVTLITDGIVEARNKSGELYGFDRAASLAKEDAESIAQTAQEFGQEDDITVICLERKHAVKETVRVSEPPELFSAPT
jgi:hypothetical protein